jgi:hypothetical protein
MAPAVGQGDWSSSSNIKAVRPDLPAAFSTALFLEGALDGTTLLALGFGGGEADRGDQFEEGAGGDVALAEDVLENLDVE